MADAFPPPPRMSKTSDHVRVAEPPPPVLSDVVLILICVVVVGVGLVARLAMVVRRAWLWLRRSSTEGSSPPSLPPPNGLNMEDLLALPRLSYEGAVAITGGRLADCAICLAEFEEGNEIRVLPQCGHNFHVDCVDRWLSSHSSCPSCRRVVVVSVTSS